MHDDTEILLVDDVRVLTGEAESIDIKNDSLSVFGYVDPSTNKFVIEYDVTYLGQGDQVQAVVPVHPTPTPTAPPEPGPEELPKTGFAGGLVRLLGIGGMLAAGFGAFLFSRKRQLNNR